MLNEYDLELNNVKWMYEGEEVTRVWERSEQCKRATWCLLYEWERLGCVTITRRLGQSLAHQNGTTTTVTQRENCRPES